LGVSALISGRVASRGDTIEISAELTDLRDNTEIWGQHYSGKSSGMMSLQERMSGDVAEKLRPRLNTSERQQITNQGTQNSEAYDLYLKGQYAWTKRTVPSIYEGIDLFNKALAKDPNYARAYAGLADAYSVLPIYAAVSPSEAFPKSIAAAHKALELDPTLAHAHVGLAADEMEFELTLQPVWPSTRRLLNSTRMTLPPTNGTEKNSHFLGEAGSPLNR
jgi:tetratricopeptide (TPR) repeat protein